MDEWMSDVGWEYWFQRNIAKAGGFFKFMYDSWVYCAPLYNALYALLPPPRRILEVGCGYGTSAAILSLLGYDVLGIDIDPKMLEHARGNLASLGLADRVRLELGDAFNLSKYHGIFDATFSDGVLEHFHLDEAVAALKEQARAAKYIVATIPTKYLREETNIWMYPHTPRSFKAICHKAGLKILRFLAFGDPNGRHFQILREALPQFIYYHLRRKFFPVTVAAICTSKEYD